MIINNQNLTQNPESSLIKTSKFIDENNYPNKVLQYKINFCDKNYKNRVINSNQPDKQIDKLYIQIDKHQSADQQNNQISNFLVPTFGNWKKQKKLTNLSLQATPYRYQIMNKKMIKLLNGQNFQRNYSKGRKHPKIPKNCKFLSIFCSNENSDQYIKKVLPNISRKQKLVNSQRTALSHRSYLKSKNLQNNKKQIMKYNFVSKQVGKTLSTRQSCQLKDNLVDQLKKQFKQMYLKQKQRYQSIITAKRIKYQIKDEEFQSFLERMQNKI